MKIRLIRHIMTGWIISHPRTLYRLLRGVFRALVLRRNTLRVLYLFPTFDCQAKCRMCSTAKFKKGQEDALTLADYESIAEQGARMGVVAVTLLGGEPLLVTNLDEIIRIFKSHHFFISIVTNGIALTRDYARKLRSAGLDSMHFGLESLDEEVNDRLRGFPGQCRKVMEGIEICKDEGLAVGLCTVFFPGELRRYEELADYCEANDIRLSLPSLAAVGGAEDMRRAGKEQYEQVLGLLKSHPRVSVDWAFSYFLRPACPAGKEKIAITCYGDVFGCSLNHISFGNVKDEPLETIWRRAGRFSQFRKHSPCCLAAFDPYHIDNFLVPLARFDRSPVHYVDHPNITPESEPDLFGR